MGSARYGMAIMWKRTIALLLLVPLGGCAVAAVGAAAGAAYVWINGELKSTVSAALPRVEEATKAVFDDLEFTAVEAVSDKLKGKVTAMMADGTDVVVRLKAVDFESTQVRIRVGKLGDKAVSEQIHRHLEKELGIEKK